MEKIRRYDLDWLRVLVFALLIFYHVGMFFVPWGWHIKNNVIYREALWPMLFVNQWRLPILFVISGMGTAFALAYRTVGQFRRERLLRLYVPLAFGMLVIVPPQVYLERVTQGLDMGYGQWLIQEAFSRGVYPEGNISWHHLWFLPYLLVYSLLLAPVFVRIRNHPDGKFLNAWRRRLDKQPWSLLWLVIPLFLYESLLEPFFNITHNLIWDWFNFTSSMTLFFYGFFLISIKEDFWVAVDKLKHKTLVLGVVTFSGLLIRWLFFEDSIVVHFSEAALKTINLWAWILTIFGYAAHFLNKGSDLLAYCNRAVYPFYILHQTITIMLGFYLMNLDWPFWPKFLAMVMGTFGGSWLIYEFVIRRVRWLHPLFGLKGRS